MVTKIAEKTSELTTEYLAALGRVVTQWSRFELRLDLEISFLVGASDVGMMACVTAQIPISARKMDAVIALFGQHGASDDALKPLRSLAGRADELQRKRNRYIHDAWAFGTETDTAYRLEITAQKSLVWDHKVVPLSELTDFAKDVDALVEKFDDASDALRAHESASVSMFKMLRARRLASKADRQGS